MKSIKVIPITLINFIQINLQKIMRISRDYAMTVEIRMKVEPSTQGEMKAASQKTVKRPLNSVA